MAVQWTLLEKLKVVADLLECSLSTRRIFSWGTSHKICTLGSGGTRQSRALIYFTVMLLLLNCCVRNVLYFVMDTTKRQEMAVFFQCFVHGGTIAICTEVHEQNTAFSPNHASPGLFCRCPHVCWSLPVEQRVMRQSTIQHPFKKLQNILSTAIWPINWNQSERPVSNTQAQGRNPLL